MMSNLPKGLLDLLGLQSFGEAPRQLMQEVFGVVDLAEFLLSNKLETLGGNRTTPAGGFNTITSTSIVVPAGELWVPKVFAVYGTAEAGVTFNIAPALRFGGSSVGPTLAPAVAVAAGGTSSNGLPISGLYLPAGTDVGVRVDAITGAPTAASQVNVNLLFARLRAGG